MNIAIVDMKSKIVGTNWKEQLQPICKTGR